MFFWVWCFAEFLLLPNTFGHLIWHKVAPCAISLQARNVEIRQDSHRIVNHQPHPPTAYDPFNFSRNIQQSELPCPSRRWIINSPPPWNPEAVRYTESSSLGWEEGQGGMQERIDMPISSHVYEAFISWVYPKPSSQIRNLFNFSIGTCLFYEWNLLSTAIIGPGYTEISQCGDDQNTDFS